VTLEWSSYALIGEGSDLFLLYFIVGEVLLVLLPVLAGRGRLGQVSGGMAQTRACMECHSKGGHWKPTMMSAAS
jgi:hypothetical protein